MVNKSTVRYITVCSSWVQWKRNAENIAHKKEYCCIGFHQSQFRYVGGPLRGLTYALVNILKPHTYLDTSIQNSQSQALNKNLINPWIRPNRKMPKLQVSRTHFCFDIISFDLNTNFNYSKVSLQTYQDGWNGRAVHISPSASGERTWLVFLCAHSCHSGCLCIPPQKQSLCSHGILHMNVVALPIGPNWNKPVVLSCVSRPCMIHLCSGKLQQQQNDPCNSVGAFPGIRSRERKSLNGSLSVRL